MEQKPTESKALFVLHKRKKKMRRENKTLN